MSAPPTAGNLLYYGDNLPVLREFVSDASVDLVYLDPPFKSDATYNMLFKEHDGERAAAQIKAFEDTWRWDAAAAIAFHSTVDNGGRPAEALLALRQIVGDSDMLAYLSMMAPRLVELRRVLKPTGSLYLHCDPTASHYLKLLLDAIFGPENFRAEIIWKRSSAHSDSKQGMRQPGRIHDVLLFYTRTDEWVWNPTFVAYDREYIESHYPAIDAVSKRQYTLSDLTAAKPGGDTRYDWRVKRRVGDAAWEADTEREFENPRQGWEYRGVKPSEGRYWAYSKENMRIFAAEDRLQHTKTGTPRYKRYLDEMPGVPLQDMWTDIPPLNSQAAERLGYPTQKPSALLERIISASSRPGDLILDPFCGCGTAISAAQRLGRRWMGIDVTRLAINLIKSRLSDEFGREVRFTTRGEPANAVEAQQLAHDSPFDFQCWALGLVGAPWHDTKKGADRGIDGTLFFRDGTRRNETKKVILSVKAGHVHVSHLRDLRGVVDREKAAIGVLISLEPPTRQMRQEAASAGVFETPWGRHPRLQLLTIADLFSGKAIDYPRTAGTDATIRRAARVAAVDAIPQDLFTEAIAASHQRSLVSRRRDSRRPS